MVGIKTLSPALMFIANNAKCIPEVPLLQASANFELVKEEISNFKNANIDLKGIKLLTKIAFKGDDGALKVICKVIEDEGFEIRSPDEFIKDVKLPLGHLAGPNPNKNS